MKSMINSSLSFRAVVLGATVLLGLGSLAVAEDPKSSATVAMTAKPDASRSTVDATPTNTSASFGDWVLRCQRLGKGSDTSHVCEVAQQIRPQDQQNPLAEVAIGRLKKSDPLLLTVVLPVNVAFPNSPSFSPDAKDSDLLDLGWRKCLPGGCFADVALKEDVLQRWKAQSGNGRLTWKDAAGRDFAIGVSSSGLAQALDAFSKEQ
jgi:invasion protein IalB